MFLFIQYRVLQILESAEMAWNYFLGGGKLHSVLSLEMIYLGASQFMDTR